MLWSRHALRIMRWGRSSSSFWTRPPTSSAPPSSHGTPLHLQRHLSVTSWRSDLGEIIKEDTPAYQDSDSSWQEITSIEKILEASNEGAINMKNASSALKRLGQLQIQGQKVPDANDPRFQRLLDLFASDNVKRLPIGSILNCIKRLDDLGTVSKDHEAFLSLENRLLWCSRSATFWELNMMLSFLHKRRNTESRVRLFKELVKTIERRWVEISDGRAFVGILHYPECFSLQFLDKLDDRMIEVAEGLSPAELTMILSKLGEKKRRSVPVLKALVFHLTKGANSLNIKEISDSLFALRALSYKDSEILETLCQSVKVSEIESFTIVRSLLTSLGQIRFLHCDLMDKLCSWMTENVDKMDDTDLAPFLLTSATLDYIPKQSEKLFEEINQRLNFDTVSKFRSKGREQFWLDIVWSMAVLGKVQTKQLESVLTPEFFNKLLYSQDHRNVGAILKLLNLNAVAKFLTPGYSGPLIAVDDDPLLRDIRIRPGSAKSKLSEWVVEAFSNLATPPKNAKVNVNSMMGFVCDVECVINQQLNPLDIEEFGSLEKLERTGKELPEGSKRIAVISLPFQDCLVDGSKGGMWALNERLLRGRGFVPIIVTYRDIHARLNIVDRVKLLRAKLKNAMSVQ